MAKGVIPPSEPKDCYLWVAYRRIELAIKKKAFRFECVWIWIRFLWQVIIGRTVFETLRIDLIM
jgi:hypothetical protein